MIGVVKDGAITPHQREACGRGITGESRFRGVSATEMKAAFREAGAEVSVARRSASSCKSALRFDGMVNTVMGVEAWENQ